LFYQCKNIISADLSNFNSSNVDYTIFMWKLNVY
jgi:surface protein